MAYHHGWAIKRVSGRRAHALMEVVRTQSSRLNNSGGGGITWLKKANWSKKIGFSFVDPRAGPWGSECERPGQERGGVLGVPGGAAR